MALRSTQYRPHLPSARAPASPRGQGGVYAAPVDNRLRLIGQLSLLFFLLLPVEGVLRKWVFHGAEQILGFIRDPVLLAIYVLYLSVRGSKLPAWAIVFLLFAGGMTAIELVNAIFLEVPPVVTVLGLRSYFLYVPLAFIIGDTWSERDMRNFLMICLCLSIPVAALVYLQFISPVASPINKGITDDIAGRFTVIKDIIRPYGPFTFVQAQNTFAALEVAAVVIAFESMRRFKLPLWLVGGGAFAALSMGALSGGRTFFGSALLIGGAYAIAAFTSPKASRGALRVLVLIFVALSFVFVFTHVFSKSYDAMSERQKIAERAEGSTTGRALSWFTKIDKPLQEAPAFGHGLGVGSNAALKIMGLPQFLYGETEWERIVQELGPFFGLVIILVRVAMTVWLFLLALKTNRSTGDGTALIMFGFCGYLVLIAQTTGQNQLLSFCWFSVGAMLAACRLAQQREGAKIQGGVLPAQRLRAAGRSYR